MPLIVGDVYKGVLRVEQIKHGGMGTIYICRYLPSDQMAKKGVLQESCNPAGSKPSNRKRKRTVLKTVPADFYQSGDNAERFTREALIWTILPPHPYVISSSTIDIDLDSAPTIMMEYAEGGSLRDYLTRNMISVSNAMRLFRQFCVGMHFLFSFAEIIHRDIKPENILLSNNDDVKITDFGLASLGKYRQVVNFAENADSFVSAPHITHKFLGGTLPYMSPEHFGMGDITIASDIYSFGSVMFEVIEGKLLFDCSSPGEFRRAHLTAQAPQLSISKAPKSLASIVSKCLEKNPAQRFANFNELDDALTEVITKENIIVQEPERPSVDDLEQQIDAAGWNRRGYAYGVLSQYEGSSRYLEDSLRCYERSLELGPEALSTHLNVGTALRRLGRLDDALPYFEREVELHNNMPLAHAALAAAYQMCGREKDALRHLEIAADLETPDIRILRDLCVFYRRLGRDSDCENIASRIYKMMMSSSEDYQAVHWVNEGIQFGLKGELQISLRFFDEAVHRFPKNTDALYNRAVTLLFKQDIKSAEDSIRRALAINANLIQAHFLLGILHLLGGDAVNAVMAFQHVKVIGPHHRLSNYVDIFLSTFLKLPPEIALKLILSKMTISNLYYR